MWFDLRGLVEGLRRRELVGERKKRLELLGSRFLLDLRNEIVKMDRKRIMRIVVESIVEIVVAVAAVAVAVVADAVVVDEYPVVKIHHSDVFAYFQIATMMTEYSGFQVGFRPSIYFVKSAREDKR